MRKSPKRLAQRDGHREIPEVRKILQQNGREELRHAHRVNEAIDILSGKPFPIPMNEENPIFSSLDPMPVTHATLTKLAETKFAGRALYEGIAASFDSPRAISLLHLNGQEEVGYGEQLFRAAQLCSPIESWARAEPIPAGRPVRSPHH